MKIKLNRDKMQSVHDLISHLLAAYPAEDKAERLLHKLINRVRIKFRNRLDQVNERNGYQVTLTEDEALALDIWFNQVVLPADNWIYERLQVEKMCNEADRLYG